MMVRKKMAKEFSVKKIPEIGQSSFRNQNTDLYDKKEYKTNK